MKTDLLALYIKHDSHFQTISKMALAELILKIVYFSPKKGASLAHIRSELETICSGKINTDDILNSIAKLKNKIFKNGNKYFITNEYKGIIDFANTESEHLHNTVIDKYFMSAETPKEIILDWFKSLTISFFEKYNFEWFHIITSKEKPDINLFNLNELLSNSFENNNGILDRDKDWLCTQYFRFVNESDVDADRLFWQYGLSSFSARLISASNFANKINVDEIRDTTYLLDTNVLMILDLESHQLNGSIKVLEEILYGLNIKMEYLYCTKEEYRGAMSWRRQDLKKVFEEYDLGVLCASDCPFIRTALNRQCSTADDIDRLFDQLEIIPEKFSSQIDITLLEDRDIDDAIEMGRTNNRVREKINTKYKQLRFRDKREQALIHDEALVLATNYLRQRNRKYTILTNDTVLKRYSTENTIRDEQGVAIGLDTLIGLLSVSSGGTNIDPTEFAPLFKNIVNASLVPFKDSFTVADLSFMLGVHLSINKLPNERIISIARLVNRKLSANENDEDVSLYLRREIEGERMFQTEELALANKKHEMLSQQRDDAQEYGDTIVANFRRNRKAILMRQYRWRKFGGFAILTILIGLIIWLEYVKINPKWGIWGSICLTVLLYVLGCVNISKYFIRNKISYERQVDVRIEAEIDEMSQKH